MSQEVLPWEPSRSLAAGRGRTPADTVEISIHLETKRPDYGELTRLSDTKYAGLVGAVEACGFTSEELRTSALHVNAEYEYNADRQRVFAGYVMSQELALRFPFTAERLGRVLDALYESRADASLEIRFVCGSLAGQRKQLRRDAVADALLTAQTLTAAAGLRLKSILSIEYLGGRGEDASATQLRPVMLRAAAANVTPEEIEAEEAVQIVWETEEI